jgi:hypothetical protein
VLCILVECGESLFLLIIVSFSRNRYAAQSTFTEESGNPISSHKRANRPRSPSHPTLHLINYVTTGNDPILVDMGAAKPTQEPLSSWSSHGDTHTPSTLLNSHFSLYSSPTHPRSLSLRNHDRQEPPLSLATTLRPARILHPQFPPIFRHPAPPAKLVPRPRRPRPPLLHRPQHAHRRMVPAPDTDRTNLLL